LLSRSPFSIHRDFGACFQHHAELTFVLQIITVSKPHYLRDGAWFGACLARAQFMQGDAEAAVTTALGIAPDAIALKAYAVTEFHRTAHDLTLAGAPGAKAIKESLKPSKQ